MTTAVTTQAPAVSAELIKAQFGDTPAAASMIKHLDAMTHAASVLSVAQSGDSTDVLNTLIEPWKTTDEAAEWRELEEKRTRALAALQAIQDKQTDIVEAALGDKADELVASASAESANAKKSFTEHRKALSSVISAMGLDWTVPTAKGKASGATGTGVKRYRLARIVIDGKDVEPPAGKAPTISRDLVGALGGSASGYQDLAGNPASISPDGVTFEVTTNDVKHTVTLYGQASEADSADETESASE
jgi:hypothetical protein